MPRRPYRILQWNCRGARGHLAELRAIIKLFLPDIILLNETLLALADEFLLEAYSSFRLDRVAGQEGSRGIAILVRRDSPAEVDGRLYEATDGTTGEWLGLHLRFDGGSDLIVATGYNNPHQRLDDAFLRDTLLGRGCPTIFAGDLNAWCEEAGCAVLNASGNVVSTLLEDDNAFLLNAPDEPTRFQDGDVPRALDLWLCNRAALRLVNSARPVVFEQYGSDHCVTMLEFNIEVKASATAAADDQAPPQDPAMQLLRYDFSPAHLHAYVEAVTEELLAIDYLKPKHGDSKFTIDAYYNAIVQAIFQAANRSLPIRHADDLPRFQLSRVVERAISDRTSAERAWKRNKSEAAKVIFNASHRRVAAVIVEEKQRERQRKLALIEQLFREHKLRQAWQLSNQFLRGKSSKPKGASSPQAEGWLDCCRRPFESASPGRKLGSYLP